MDKAVNVIQVIVTNIERRGDGVYNPVRIITQYWDMSGKLLIEHDPCADIVKPENREKYIEEMRKMGKDKI